MIFIDMLADVNRQVLLRVLICLLALTACQLADFLLPWHPVASGDVSLMALLFLHSACLIIHQARAEMFEQALN